MTVGIRGRPLRPYPAKAGVQLGTATGVAHPRQERRNWFPAFAAVR